MGTGPAPPDISQKLHVSQEVSYYNWRRWDTLEQEEGVWGLGR